MWYPEINSINVKGNKTIQAEPEQAYEYTPVGGEKSWKTLKKMVRDSVKSERAIIQAM